MSNGIKYKLAILSFIILLTATFFGTSIPFSGRVESVEDIGTSNIVNQLVYGFLFLISVVLLISEKSTIVEFIKKEKFLSLLVLWCLISITWSPDWLVSLKRIFRLLTIIMVCITFLVNVKSESDLLKYFKYFFYIYLILSLVAVIVIPEAKDPQFGGAWRGFSPHKNGLGQAAIISSILSYLFVLYSKKSWEKMIANFMLLISIALLVGSYSSTAYTTMGLLVFLWLIFSVDTLFKPLGVRRIFSFLLILSLLVVVIMIFAWNPETKDFFPELFGKDSSFSGRTDLWEYVFNEGMKHPFHGAGYQGYWNVTRLQYSGIYDEFLWLPNQAHNGYIDVFNELGLVGILLFVILIFYSFLIYYKVSKPHPWILFIIVAILTNFSESTFFRPGKAMNFMFLFSYLHLQYSLLNEKLLNK